MRYPSVVTAPPAVGREPLLLVLYLECASLATVMRSPNTLAGAKVFGVCYKTTGIEQVVLRGVG